MSQQVGVISDTHGLLRPEAIAALQGVDLILHAGDIGKQAVLEELGAIAPVIAVRGNNDREPWAEAIPERQIVRVEDLSIHLLHIIQELSFVPQTSGIHVIVSGHSHKPLLEGNYSGYKQPSSPSPFSQVWRRGTEPVQSPSPHLGEGFRVRAD